MNEKEIRWQQPGVITCVTAANKPVEYKLDWRRLWVQLDDYEVLSTYSFFDAPNLTGFTFEGEKWQELSPQGRQDYLKQLRARVKAEDEPKKIVIRGNGKLIDAVVNVLPIPEGDDYADGADAIKFENVTVEVKASGKAVEGTLFVSDKGINCHLWIDEDGMAEIISVITSRHRQPKLEVGFAALLFRKEGIGYEWMTRQAIPFLFPHKDGSTPAVLNKLCFLDSLSHTVPVKEPMSVGALMKNELSRNVVWLLPVAVAGLLLVFGR
ncbi:hypothetical protein CN140_11020 [Sinorhizobium meliloti]|uniref:hypothetical protein n=1 Tax=Rhizobium meliloti TaxID=382 RepID=UPI000FD78FF8|nr:hypothetical protein [Sinorhizobium meliloti]RVL84860.1 hypothetical protein CN140_11020 [Sinorhizobium meliloti]